MSYTWARLGAAELPGEFPSLPCGSPRLLVPPSPRASQHWKAERAGLAGLWFKKTTLRNQWKQAICLILFCFSCYVLGRHISLNCKSGKGKRTESPEIGVLLSNLGKVARNKTEVSHVMTVRIANLLIGGGGAGIDLYDWMFFSITV